MIRNRGVASKRIVSDLVVHYPPLAACEAEIWASINLLVSIYRQGNKLLICGNGGSAADSEHIVGELMKSFRFKRDITSEFKREYREMFNVDAPEYLEGALPAISLSSHTALGTAFANDENSIGVFAQQVYGYGVEGDVFLGISTSGLSGNVLEAARVAKAKHMKVIGLTGSRSSDLSCVSDISIRVPETETYLVQELHLPVYHALCAAVESELFQK